MIDAIELRIETHLTNHSNAIKNTIMLDSDDEVLEKIAEYIRENHVT